MAETALSLEWRACAHTLGGSGERQVAFRCHLKSRAKFTQTFQVVLRIEGPEAPGMEEMGREERVAFTERKAVSVRTQGRMVDLLTEHRPRTCNVPDQCRRFRAPPVQSRGAPGAPANASHTLCRAQICSEMSYPGLSVSLLAEIQRGFSISRGVNNRVCILVLYLLGIL